MPRYEVALLADVLEVASLVSDGHSSGDGSALSVFVKDVDTHETVADPRNNSESINGSREAYYSQRNSSEGHKTTQYTFQSPRKDFNTLQTHQNLKKENKNQKNTHKTQQDAHLLHFNTLNCAQISLQPQETLYRDLVTNRINPQNRFNLQKSQKTHFETYPLTETSLDLNQTFQESNKTNLTNQNSSNFNRDNLLFEKETPLSNSFHRKSLQDIKFVELNLKKCTEVQRDNFCIHKNTEEIPLNNLTLKKNPLSHLNNSTSHLDYPVISPENVELALMGNGQCCFRRYPGYQAHRHVVVSRGVQCNELILRKNTDFISPRTNEKGDIGNLFPQQNMRNNDSTPLQKQKADFKSTLKSDFIKNKPEIYTLVTEEPPELRESSKFYQKKFPIDLIKCRKYFDDDIDSLSATISNYSLHERLLKFDNFKYNNEQFNEKEKNNQQPCNLFCRTPTPRQRQISFKGSTDAIRGSTTKTLTCHSNDKKINKNEYLENQSCSSFTSFGNFKDNKVGLISNSGDNTESTPIDTEKVKDNEQLNANNGANFVYPSKTEETFKLFLSRSAQSQNAKSKNLPFYNNLIENTPQEKPGKSNSDSKCSSSVTFMKGSEELNNEEKAKSLEFNNLNILRRKQKFLMRHTRNNSKFTTLNNNSDCAPVITSPEFPSHFSAIKGDSTPIPLRPEASTDYQEIHIDTSNQKHFARNLHFTPPNNESSRNNCASRNSNHSERVLTHPITNMIKLKRTVSFDNNKAHDNLSKSLTYQKNSKIEHSNQTCTRNTVRAKYCSNKIIRQRFYIPESANIELILRDPSDRRIKAICDRHNCDIEVYSKVPKSGFLKNIIVLAAPNNENLRKCVRSLDYSMCWCLTAQLP